MWSDNSDAESEVVPAVLQRPKIANHIVQERVTVETSDHEDHTFCGVMFDVKCLGSLPVEFFEITDIAVRGALGPMTVWTTPDTFQDKFRTDDSHRHWTLIYEETHPSSVHHLVPLNLHTPVRLAAGESCGLFVHSKRPSDDSVVYDNLRTTLHNRQGAADSGGLLTILPGLAALDPTPFGQMGMWGEGWRSRREFVGRVNVGVCWRLWNPEAHRFFPRRFRAAVRCLLLCSTRQDSQLHFLSDAVIFYVLNMCRWDWFGDELCEAVVAQSAELQQRVHTQPRGRAFIAFDSDSDYGD